ncbi:MAG TPA: hypothetical protein VLM79_04985 [Kofleriaceae bacterium]|nr:hypothetical protein [Kofleriaceae bacterium]
MTSLPSSVSTQDAVDLTYERCDQENVIAQLGSGLAAWRMPVAEFDGNSAWLEIEIARLAWNLGKWIALLALPAEVVRWEWKRFRQAFVYAAAYDPPSRTSGTGKEGDRGFLMLRKSARHPGEVSPRLVHRVDLQAAEVHAPHEMHRGPLDGATAVSRPEGR